MRKRNSLELFRLKKILDMLSRKEGRGTQLISLYVPEGRQVSDVLSMLKQESGTASNIKSNTTRKNVQDAIVKVKQRVKLFRKIPKNGLVVFCGAILQNGPGSEKIETYVIKPPEPINVYLYRCDARFHTEYLLEMLKEKETYGIIIIDASATTFAILRGKHLEITQEITSGVPGKTRAGGQSARRFERLREARLIQYYKRIGEHAEDIFLPLEDLKGIIISGPGPTKLEFEKGNYLHYALKDKILARIDTAYVGRQGVEEVTERAPEILRRVRYVEEKQLMQDFLYEVGHDTGFATYGENEVRQALKMGAVKMLLVSEDVDLVRVKTNCSVCDYEEERTLKSRELLNVQQNMARRPCPKCKSPSLSMGEPEGLVEELAQLAEQSGVTAEVISVETEEGEMLKQSFGGIAATLRFKR